MPTALPRIRGRPRGRFTQHRRYDALRTLLLQKPKGMTLQEIADALAVTRRSARRYLNEVGREYELESASSGARARLWRLRPEDRPRKVGLRRTQAYALLAARSLFEPMRGSALYEEIELALTSITAIANRPGRGPNAGVADARLERRFLYVPHAPTDYSAKAEELDVLYQAVANLRVIVCRYHDATGKESTIKLHPYALVLHRDAIYAVGRKRGEKSVRAFALHAISNAELASNERFEIPEDFDLRTFRPGRERAGKKGREGKTRVVIDFAPAVVGDLRVRRLHPSQRLSALRGGGVRWTGMVSDSGELLEHVLSYGPFARVVEPETLREQVLSHLRSTLALYRERKA